ncbi:hypothetical protein AYL99_10021 [Fonsecaea erecta]|uniref:Uncharacterized protein n=1 Tax=Fonsecaea erecta TaxID=1367422 RepID=A0A178Z7W1_9EURO|nr:hypothetical protein AYL99_10021 [Fonsecaea erecta]OAP55869.1 hypothetical protein AYL99_10021 [Fonsecaea erecta]
MNRLPPTNSPSETRQQAYDPSQIGSQTNTSSQPEPQANSSSQTGPQTNSPSWTERQMNDPSQLGPQTNSSSQMGPQAYSPSWTSMQINNPSRTGLQINNPSLLGAQAYSPSWTGLQMNNTSWTGPPAFPSQRGHPAQRGLPAFPAQTGLQAYSPSWTRPSAFPSQTGLPSYSTSWARMQINNPSQTGLPPPSPRHTGLQAYPPQRRLSAMSPQQTGLQTNSPPRTTLQASPLPPTPPSQTRPQAKNPSRTRQQGTTTSSRAPRSRPTVPRSDPHQDVPADFQFPTAATRIGSGLNSGRNLLVIRQGTSQPVTRVPLIIERGRNDRHRGGHYPHQDTPLPAGLTLEQIIRSYPRHAWGTMLRVFLAEGWPADRIWRLMPEDMRNTKSAARPWNYIQAAMGREIDRMAFEDTGVHRVPPKRERTSKDNDSGEDQSDAEAVPEATESTTPSPSAQGGQPVLTAADLTFPHLQEIARITHAETMEVREIIRSYGPRGETAFLEWRQMRRDWARRIRHAYATDTGLEMATNNPVQMLGLLWRSQNPARQGESAEAYRARANLHIWGMWTRESQRFLKELKSKLAGLEGKEEENQGEKQENQEENKEEDEGDVDDDDE